MSNGGDQRCPSCFRPTNAPPCPHCGFEGTDERNPLILPLGFELDDRYRIGHVLGKPGGFGITYLAFDERLQTRVAVKEYLPREIAARGSDGASVRLYSADEEDTFEYGLDRFLGEARALARFDHANIVGVQDFFEANGTAYLAMDYYEGKTLKQYLQEQPGGRMDPENATEIMLRVLDGLKEVHVEGYLHRDIKPDNIYLTAEGRPILIDFGAARLALGERSRSLSVVMTEGYAPYEQYHRKGDQGPWTDVYGCGATLYRMVTGETPPPAAERVVEDDLRPPHDLNAEVSPALSRGIVGALGVQEEDRPQTASALQERLQGGGRHAGESQEPSPDREEEPPTPPSSEAHTPGGDGTSEGGAAPGAEPKHEQGSGVRWPTVAVGILLVAALGLGGLAVAFYPSGSESTAQETEQAASEDPSSNPSTRSKTEQLLKEARGHLDAGRLTSPEGTNALSAVQQALGQDPGSEEAQELLARIADRLAEKGTAARDQGKLQAAVDFYERSLEIENQPDVRERLNKVHGRIDEQEKVQRLLGEVRSILRQKSPSAEALQRSAGSLKQVLSIDSDNEEARRLRQLIARRLVESGDSAREEGRISTAASLYDLSLQFEGQPKVREKLDAVRSQIQKSERYDRLLSEIRSTLKQETPSAGELESAARAAREARELRPERGTVKQFLDQIADRAMELGQEAYASSRYKEAVGYYEEVVKINKNIDFKNELEKARGKIKSKKIVGNIEKKMEKGKMSKKELREAEDSLSIALSYDWKNNEARSLLTQIKSMRRKGESEVASSGRGLVRQVREALGGAAFNDIKSMRVVTKQKGRTSTLIVELPNKMRVERGGITIASNGQTVKMQRGGKTRALPASVQGRITGQLWRSVPYLMANLDHDDLSFRAKADTTISGTTYKTVQVQPPSGTAFTLHLDAETMRPKRLSYEQTNPRSGATVGVTRTLSDFREVSGAMVPFTTKTVQSTSKGERTITSNTQELEINVDPEAELFTLE